MTTTNMICIGLDQSYTRTGLSIAWNGELVVVSSIEFKGCTTKSDKRRALAKRLREVIEFCLKKTNQIMVIIERIRTFTKGKGGNNQLRPQYLKAVGALNATIVDVAAEYGLTVWSVDTRSWKAKILGKSTVDARHQKEIKPEKMLAIEYIISLGFDVHERKKDGTINKSVRGKNEGKIKYDDDAADSGCIALYGFLPDNKRNLQVEE